MAPLRRVYITGFMGSGKTTAGKKLASALDFSFIDLDQEIERRERRPVGEIFAISGEDYFRKAESEALHDLCIKADTVISTGGGTPCFGDNLLFMKKTGILIYLKMTPMQLQSRLSESDGKRPLLKDLKENELVDYITAKLKEREPFYEQSTLIVDGMNMDIKSLKNKIFLLFS